MKKVGQEEERKHEQTIIGIDDFLQNKPPLTTNTEGSSSLNRLFKKKGTIDLLHGINTQNLKKDTFQIGLIPTGQLDIDQRSSCGTLSINNSDAFIVASGGMTVEDNNLDGNINDISFNQFLLQQNFQHPVILPNNEGNIDEILVKDCSPIKSIRVRDRGNVMFSTSNITGLSYGKNDFPMLQ